MNHQEVTKIVIGRIQVTNLITNILTVVLFIAFSAVNRFDVRFPSLVFAILFFLNAVTCAVLWRCNRHRTVETQIGNGWLIVRFVANIGLSLLASFS